MSDDLKDALKSLKTLQPPAQEMESWQLAVQSELLKPKVPSRRPQSEFYIQLAVAMIAGFILGAAVFGGFRANDKQTWSENLLTDATIEHTHTNLD